MILTNSNAAKVGVSNVSAIASSTALFSQFMVYAATTISSVISGTIGLIKNGTGTLTLTGANTYTGTSNINNGTLQVAGTSYPTGRTYSIASGAILDMDVIINLNSASNIFNGNGTLILKRDMGRIGSSVGTATFALGSSGLIDIKASAILNSVFGGGYDFTSNLATLNLDGTIQGDSGFTLNAGGLTGSGTILNPATELVIGGNNASTTFTGAIQDTSSLIKNGTGTLTLSNPSPAFDLSNNYTGTTTINNGTLTLVTIANTLFYSPITVNVGGTLVYVPTANSTINSLSSTVNLQGAMVYNTLGNFYLTMISAVTVNAPSTISLTSVGISSAGLYLDGGLKGSSNVTVTSNTNGLGLVLRNANSTYTGTLTANGNASSVSGTGSGLAIGPSTALSSADLVINGTLELGDAATGMGWSLGAVRGTTVSIDSLNGTGVVVGNMKTAASTRTLSVGNNNGTGDFSGVIVNGVNNTLTFIKNGTGIQTMRGINTYTGTTTIGGGTLEIGSTGLLGNGTYSAAIINNGIFLFGSNSNQTLSGIISGTGVLTKSGTGTLITNAVNTYTGGTTVSAGTLQIGSGTNATARVLNTTTLSGGNLAYNFNANNTAVNGSITLTATATITKLNGLRQINLQTGTLNGGGQTLNIYVDTTAGTAPLYFNGTAGTSLSQINILNGGVGQEGTGGLPLRNAAINISSGAQFRTYNSPTINNNITLNGGAGPDGNGALWNESVVAAHTPVYIGIITLASGTNSSVGNTTSGFTITGQITGAGAFTKIGTGMLTTYNNSNNYTGSTTISAGTLRVIKAFGAITPTASFTSTTLSVSFSGTLPSGVTNFRFFQGTTTNAYASVTLVSVPAGATATYTSATSTLSVTVP